MSTINIPPYLLDFTDIKNIKMKPLMPYKQKLGSPSNSSLDDSLLTMILIQWFCFRLENEEMRKIYPANSIAIEYLLANNINSKIETTNSKFYNNIEKIFMEYIITNPQRFVSIRFINDDEIVTLIKQDSIFHVVSGKINETDEKISNIFASDPYYREAINAGYKCTMSYVVRGNAPYDPLL